MLSYNICRGGAAARRRISAPSSPGRARTWSSSRRRPTPRSSSGSRLTPGWRNGASRRGQSLAVHEPGTRSRTTSGTVRDSRVTRSSKSSPVRGELRDFRRPPERALLGVDRTAGACSSCARCCASIRRHQHGFHVLTGDFNTLAPGELLDFRKLPHRLRALVWLSGGRIRWRTIQLILDAGYVDAYRMLHADRSRIHVPDLGAARAPGLPVRARGAYAGRVQACEIITGPERRGCVGSSSVPDTDDRSEL